MREDGRCVMRLTSKANKDLPTGVEKIDELFPYNIA